MPPIQYLLGLGCPFRGSFEIAAPSVPHDDLDARVSQQPVGEHLLVTAQKDLDGLVPLQIDQQSA